MALVGKDAGIDATHAMKVALVHDVAEAIVGDITPDDPVSKEDKYARGTSLIDRSCSPTITGTLAL